MLLDGHTPLCLKYQPPNEAFDFDDSFLVPLLYEDKSSLSLFANIQMDETEENLSVNQGMVRRLFVVLEQTRKFAKNAREALLWRRVLVDEIDGSRGS